MTNQEAQQLLNKYIKEECTPAEKALVERWYLSESSRQSLPNDQEDFSLIKTQMWRKIGKDSGLEYPGQKSGRIMRRTSIAAAILLIIGISAYIFYPRQSQQIIKITKPVKDIAPGSNKAVLTLADGSKIALDDTGQGIIATQAGIKIRKSSDGSILYDMPKEAKYNSRASVFNSIETPNGGKYQIVLPDGSKVWLNAGSALNFPAVFTGKERKVELIGEAFFEVAKNKAMPFIVKTREMNVSVLGTEFNVMAYEDENYTATTLVEGSVQVSNPSQKMFLKPGQQAVNKGGKDLSKRNVDVDEAIAWKNGLFQFNNSDIQTVMKQIGRWYDVSVEYRGAVPDNRFGGYISRNSHLSQVLKMLELSGVRFSIEEKKIIVLP